MNGEVQAIDWGAPIEAVHEDGRTMPVSGIHDWANDQWPHAGVADAEHIYMRDDLRCCRRTWGDMPGWSIRNVAKPSAPTPQGIAPEVVERCVALVKRVAASPKHLEGPWACEARAIVALMEPVDPIEAIAARLIDQQDEPWPWGTESDRLHY